MTSRVQSHPPHDPALDASIPILKEGFTYIQSRCRKYNSDLFLTRLLGQPTACIHGPDAARLFYDDTKLRRHGAIPRRVTTSLFGPRAVHTLDDQPHRHRKAAFLSLMTPDNLARYCTILADEWRAAIRRWQTQPSITLFDQSAQLLTRAICRWSGVPLPDADVPRRANDFVSMVDAFGGVGPRLWRGKLGRRRAHNWIIPLIKHGRQFPLSDPTAALQVMAHHRDPLGNPLDPKTAAVELLNVLRPTVAIAWYITFAALALHEHPAARAALSAEPHTPDHAGPLTDSFMQEVRRFYPFAPFLGALVRTPFEWQNHQFQRGSLVLLDLYGTNHDPRPFPDPDTFQPTRFLSASAPTPYSPIPQGGSHPATQHRCPGEWLTMHTLTLSLLFLTQRLTYDVPPDQDFSYPLSRMPTFPRGRMRIQSIHPTPTLDAPTPRLPSGSAGSLHTPV